MGNMFKVHDRRSGVFIVNFEYVIAGIYLEYIFVRFVISQISVAYRHLQAGLPMDQNILHTKMSETFRKQDIN